MDERAGATVAHRFVCTGHTPTLCTARFSHPSTMHFRSPADGPSLAGSPFSIASPPWAETGAWASPGFFFKNAASFELAEGAAFSGALEVAGSGGKSLPRTRDRWSTKRRTWGSQAGGRAG